MARLPRWVLGQSVIVGHGSSAVSIIQGSHWLVVLPQEVVVVVVVVVVVLHDVEVRVWRVASGRILEQFWRIGGTIQSQSLTVITNGFAVVVVVVVIYESKPQQRWT